MRSDGVIEGASGLAFGRITVGALDDWDAVPADGVVCWLHGGNLVIWNKGELKNIKLSGGRSDEATPVRVVLHKSAAEDSAGWFWLSGLGIEQIDQKRTRSEHSLVNWHHRHPRDF